MSTTTTTSAAAASTTTIKRLVCLMVLALYMGDSVNAWYIDDGDYGDEDAVAMAAAGGAEAQQAAGSCRARLKLSFSKFPHTFCSW